METIRGNMEDDERVLHAMTITLTLYGTDSCGECRRAMAWFDENDIAYDYVDLVEHPDQTERVLERNNGVRKIPLIVFPDDSHLVEPTNAELAAHVAALVEAGVELPTVSAETPPVLENVHLGRFELLKHGEVVSFATYRQRGDDVVVPHVETAPPHRGNGFAAELMEGMLAILRADGRTITPLCPFAAQHIRDNPEHRDLLTG